MFFFLNKKMKIFLLTFIFINFNKQLIDAVCCPRLPWQTLFSCNGIGNCKNIINCCYCVIKDANHHVNILNIYFVYNHFIINKLKKVIIENTRYNKQSDNILINPRTWMSNISGNKTIDSLSIPGTHDFGSKVFANGWIGTQDHSIKDQLNSGIRFIDIRCCHINNSFYIYHDQFYLNYNFDDIIQIVFNFLKINLNETILMRIKEEYKPNNITRSFEETFQAYYYRYKDLFWKFTSFNPTLDMIRGKIVVIQQFIGLNYGLDWNSFNITR
jgi:hypothetical protein